MHISKLLAVSAKPVEEPIKNNEILDTLVERIKDVFTDIHIDHGHNNDDNSTTQVLDINQINEIAGYMLYLEQTYFSNTRYLKLSGNLYKKFLENMPEEFFDAYMNARYNHDYPDIMNPMFYFYLFWVDDPMMGSIELIKIINELSREEF